MSGQWQDMFDQQRGSGRAIGTPPVDRAPPADRALPIDDEPAPDMAAYRPWVLQRVKSRPSMLLHLRRFEPKSGLWMGWALSYPSLIAAEYVGAKMVSLDFGTRQFMVEGEGLDQMIGALQEATVTALQEYSPRVWPVLPDGPIIGSIRRLGQSAGGSL